MTQVAIFGPKNFGDPTWKCISFLVNLINVSAVSFNVALDTGAPVEFSTATRS